MLFPPFGLCKHVLSNETGVIFAGGVRDGGAVAPFLADEWNPWEDEQVEYNSALSKKREVFKQYLGRINEKKSKRYKVQIWGKAAIGKSLLLIYCVDLVLHFLYPGNRLLNQT